ncbi:N-fatty-acyl-amino acid synthase/hydrolase PM20D1-like isoform X2 [Portunus trituberculatus]|uniref:N-fatty-acyl-amino acid synthase/hydrolase PM20D1-like isoform X2 n=1 Tax=Portunus trituberculatus TaxID=210409 RepID=UPI001E1D1EAF|nr:N-fatty-acyl-amino acid synthase/hydrolase PM20D1-like isoform X2 [Portunus trituberculatus]XP_045121425.1 N-fatty-acyl-amino acid synthase/hydrolase PM20D1-like isoform X2 [Portunus trituberculatus]
MVDRKRLAKIAGVVVGVMVGVLVLLLVVALIRALALEDFDYQVQDLDPGARDELPESYLKGLPEVMARALSIRTVSYSRGNYEVEELLRFHDFLRESFPNVFNSSIIEVEVVNKLSLLLTVKGAQDDFMPYLLMGHMDVVPVDREKWTHDPWGGFILPDPSSGESYIWGRGAIDNKVAVIGIMSALEYLASTGFQPERTFYVAFGHDEEVRGEDGAGQMGRLLQERGVKLDFILDEGLPIMKDTIKGMDKPVAAIGVTEKGWLSLELEVKGPAGHSSMPPLVSAVTVLSRALVALADNPQPSMFGSGPESDMLAYIAPKASWPQKLVFANLWLFKPIVEMVLSSKRETNALMRTTTCATIVRAGVKENVVPSSARATINHRIHPSQNIKEVIQYDKKVINDPSVKIMEVEGTEAHPVSPHGPDVAPWRLLTASIHHHFPDAITAPGVLIGYTDTRHYLPLTARVYRFNPTFMLDLEMSIIHGHDERISVSSFTSAVSFYHHLILKADLQISPLRFPPGDGM